MTGTPHDTRKVTPGGLQGTEGRGCAQVAGHGDRMAPFPRGSWLEVADAVPTAGAGGVCCGGAYDWFTRLRGAGAPILDAACGRRDLVRWGPPWPRASRPAGVVAMAARPQRWLAPGRIRTWLDETPKTGPGNKGRRKRLEDAIRYLCDRSDKVAYRTCRARDLEVGTGQVEGAPREPFSPEPTPTQARGHVGSNVRPAEPCASECPPEPTQADVRGHLVPPLPPDRPLFGCPRGLRGHWRAHGPARRTFRGTWSARGAVGATRRRPGTARGRGTGACRSSWCRRCAGR